jgi:integrase/recombinase XerD
MSNAGIPLRIIQEISGHNNLEQLQRYLEVKPDQVKGAIASLSMLSYTGKAFFPKAEALTPGFVTILDRVERVHLQNLLKGELTGDVA